MTQEVGSRIALAWPAGVLALALLAAGCAGSPESSDGLGSDESAPLTDAELAAVAPGLIEDESSPDSGEDTDRGAQADDPDAVTADGVPADPPDSEGSDAGGSPSQAAAEATPLTGPASEENAPTFEGEPIPDEAAAVAEAPTEPPQVPRGPPSAVVGRVDAVQLPAAILRQGIKAGIKPGWALYAGDKIATGAQGRVVLSLVDGSKLQLGSATEAELDVPWVLEDRKDGRSGLRVVRGNFRFIASRLVRPGVPRPTIALGETVRATVRAGEIWGESTSVHEQLVLVAGSVLAQVSDRPSVQMDEDETVLVVPRARPPRPVVPVPPDRLLAWLPQSDLMPGSPVLAADGGWSVSLAANPDQRAVADLACRLQARGYPTELLEVDRKGKTWHRAVIRRFATVEDATAFAQQAKQLGLSGAWVIPPG